jgi:hypothetical protein
MGGWATRKFLTALVSDGLAGRLVPRPDLLWEQENEYTQARDLEGLAIAIAGYHAQAGRWPKELSELVPDFIETIPKDRFSGQALIYRASQTGYTLYSVGRNGKDDGGEPASWHGDIVVSVK